MLIKLTLEYDGTAFCGWQTQPNGPTIQATLEQALATAVREHVRVVAAGRTDAGVHALGQVAVFRTSARPDLDALRRSLNALAGPHIAVVAAEPAPEGFDPRRDARSRVYEYRILNRPSPSPLRGRFTWHVAHALDLEAMRAAAALLVGEHDFSSFRGADCEAEHPVRRIDRSDVTRDGDLVVYRVEATAFLRHMVRNIVGTLVAVGSGDLTVEGFGTILAARDRARAGVTAPAQGLCLVAVRYEG